jgi:hypothetical protein
MSKPQLLTFLNMLDDNTKHDLRIIIKVRDHITHSGRFMISGSDGLNVIHAYWKLFELLTIIFFKILSYEPISLRKPRPSANIGN